MTTWRRTLTLLGATLLAAPATLAADGGEHSRGLWQINVEANHTAPEKPQTIEAAGFSTEPTPAGGRPSTAHVAISLGDGTTIR